MKKITINLLILLLCNISAYAQISESKMKQLKNTYDNIYMDNLNKYGYIEIEKNYKRGALDKHGNIILPCEYDEIFKTKEDLYFSIKINGKWGIADKKGHIIIPCEYDYISKTTDEKYFKVTLNNKMAIFDLNGKILFPFKYTKLYWWQIEECEGCEVETDGQLGFINKQGKEIIPCKYEYIKYYPNSKEDIYAKVKKEGKYGLFDVLKQEEVIPCIYEEQSEFPETENDFNAKYTKVKRGEKYGLYNIKKKKEVIPCEYTYINNWDNNAFVCKGGKYIPMRYNPGSSGISGKWEDDYFEEPGKWGYIELESERMVIPCEYDYLTTAGENMFQFNIGGIISTPRKDDIKGGLWCIIDSNNRIVFKAEFSNISPFQDGVAQTIKDGTASFIVNPYSGTKLLLANGVSPCAIDNNIPQTNLHNEETFAFIFANENYKNLKGAEFSINDGIVFSKYCKQTLGLLENNVRYYEDATFGNIQSAMKKIQDIAEVYDGEAKIIFYFSGLGYTDTDKRYILPTDASLSSVAATGIAIDYILAKLSELNTKYTLALFDAPFNGTDKSGKMLETARGVKIKSKSPAAEGNIIAVFGSSDDKNNYYVEQNVHGLLTYNLLEQLQKSKGKCSIKTFIENAIKKVETESLKDFKDVQRPQIVISETIREIWNNLNL